MSYWRIPPIWKGETCVILGGGLSLVDFDFSLVKDFKVIATNDAYKDEDTKTVRDWVDLAYWKDCCWYEQSAFKDAPGYGMNRIFLTNFKGLKVTSCDRYLNDPGVHVLQRGRRQRLERDPNFITHCNNTGAEALALGTMMGPKMVLLCGFDMKTVNGRHNYHENHQREITPKIYEEYFISSFEALAKDIKNLGVSVINCTIGSALDIFPIMPIEEALNAERSLRA